MPTKESLTHQEHWSDSFSPSFLLVTAAKSEVPQGQNHCLKVCWDRNKREAQQHSGRTIVANCDGPLAVCVMVVPHLLILTQQVLGSMTQRPYRLGSKATMQAISHGR